ncbi:GEVED domain-containing protein [Stieleria varia]|uniref:Dockerin type I repeat protein n=1 Tax=Stieleria varia TaxID=2528005 RepID=A0A5C6B7S4_9BACT|nr:GEVED domain-containing protein [Stieleria varia]TWU08008.1 Dockerin type I repeat protein [Stieleria varia]
MRRRRVDSVSRRSKRHLCMQSLENRRMLVAPVATDFFIGEIPLGTELSVIASDIISGFGTDADDDLSSSSLEFHNAAVDGDPVVSLASIGFSYAAAAGKSGSLSVNTSSATALVDLLPGQFATVTIGFTVRDATAQDSGVLRFTVSGTANHVVANFQIVDERSVRGDILASANVQTGESRLSVLATGVADVSQFLQSDTLLGGIGVDNLFGVTVARAFASDNSNAMARASRGSSAIADAVESSSAEATAFEESKANASAHDGSMAAAFSSDRSNASATAMRDSQATAHASIDSIASVNSEDMSIAKAISMDSSISDASAASGSNVNADARWDSFAFAGGALSSTANATSVSHSNASAAADSGSTSDAQASSRSTADANAFQDSVANSVAKDDSESGVSAISDSTAIGFAMYGSRAQASSTLNAVAESVSKDSSQSEATASNGRRLIASSSADDTEMIDTGQINIGATQDDFLRIITPDQVFIGRSGAGITLPITSTVSGGGQIDELQITNLPPGTILSAGTSNALGTSWTLDSAALPISLTPPTDFLGTIEFDVEVINRDAPDSSVSASMTLTVVSPEAVLDFGDAPTAIQSGFVNSYPVISSDDGARHGVGELRLGGIVDGENNGLPTSGANGDDNFAQSDEDGLLFLSSLVSTSDVDVISSLALSANQIGKVDGWIDFNHDGDWNDEGEQVLSSVNVEPGINQLPILIPAGSLTGNTFVRLRISSAGGLNPTGIASDGEVEDYSITVLDGNTQPSIEVELAKNHAFISEISGEFVLSADGQDLFRIPIDSLGEVVIDGSNDDDTFAIDYSTGLDPAHEYRLDGAAGDNELNLLGDQVSLDFTKAITRISNFEQIDVSGRGAFSLILDASSIASLSPQSGSVTIVADRDDVVSVGNPDNWRLVELDSVDGRLSLRATNSVSGGSESLLLDTPLMWHNFLRPSDVNNDGVATALDALRIINELASRTFSSRLTSILDPSLTAEEFPVVFFDHNRDGLITALDALRVINDLAARAASGASGESPINEFQRVQSSASGNRKQPLTDQQDRKTNDDPLSFRSDGLPTAIRNVTTDSSVTRESVAERSYQQQVDLVFADEGSVLVQRGLESRVGYAVSGLVVV